jgi:hypothetical protein
MAYAAAAHSMRAPDLSPPSRTTSTTSRFPETWCSQCGRGFGPGNAGYSHCTEHHKPLNSVFVEASKQLLNMRSPHVVGEPDRHDAEELVACLRRLAAIVDPVVAAIGSYANHHFGWVDQRLFKDQLLNALEGDATFVIEQAADNLILDQHGLRI